MHASNNGTFRSCISLQCDIMNCLRSSAVTYHLRPRRVPKFLNSHFQKNNLYEPISLYGSFITNSFTQNNAEKFRKPWRVRAWPEKGSEKKVPFLETNVSLRTLRSTLAQNEDLNVFKTFFPRSLGLPSFHVVPHMYTYVSVRD